MSLDNAIYALSQVNSLLGSTIGYINDRQNGASAGYALSNMGYNIMNGAFRNEASREILNSSGSYLGYAVNNIAGYGNPVANYQGTLGTIMSAAITSPYGIFGCNPMSSIYGCSPFGGGYFNRWFPGGGCCNNFGGPSFFAQRGFFC